MTILYDEKGQGITELPEVSGKRVLPVKVESMPDVVVTTGDIQIGAVEIKDHDTETRANVGADGLETEVKKSALPSGAATSAKQDTSNTLLGGIAGFTPAVYDFISLTEASTTDTWVFKTGGSGGTTIATVTITYTSSTKATISNITKT